MIITRHLNLSTLETDDKTKGLYNSPKLLLSINVMPQQRVRASVSETIQLMG